ncbi:MAG: DJ-1/PfpI family protein, partial [Acidimicrobiales bacterium]
MRAETAIIGAWGRDVAVVACEGLSLFEFSVAHDVFGTDPDIGARHGGSWYRLAVCGPAPGPVTTGGGLRLEVPYGLDRLARAGTVIVPPVKDPDAVPDAVLDVLRRAHRRGRRIASLCTGAFIVAAAGLLDGRRATTHWAECPALARRYPAVTVDAGVLFVDEGDVLTSAGGAASIDLCLHLVRADRGAEVATAVARQLVVPPQRDGGQAQYIDSPLPDLDDDNLFADTWAWLQQHLGDDVAVGDLAARSAMSPRTFARRFVATTGTTPYQWLVRQRVA